MRTTSRLLNSMNSASSVKANCRKVMCIGRNYADHIKELNNQRPNKPFFFLKPPSSILTPNDGPLQHPRGTIMHHEVELGLVIGKTVKDLDENDTKGAIDAIGGYVLTIDMTARNMQDEVKKKGLPWSTAKGFDTFLPIGQPIKKETIEDPQNVKIWLTVNGETKQSDSTELMLFRIPKILSSISQTMVLEPGDLVLTGTPKGVGPVQKGDVMEAGISVKGKELEHARIKVDVVERPGPYEFKSEL